MWSVIVVCVTIVALLVIFIIKYASKWLRKMKGDPGNWTKDQKAQVLKALENLHMTECSVIAGNDGALRTVCVNTAVPAMRKLAKQLVNSLSNRFTFEFAMYQIKYLSSGVGTHEAFDETEKRVSEDAKEFHKRMEVIADSLMLMREMSQLGVKNPQQSYECISNAYSGKESIDDVSNEFRKDVSKKCLFM